MSFGKNPVAGTLTALATAAIVAGGLWLSDQAGLKFSEYLGVYTPESAVAAPRFLTPPLAGYFPVPVSQPEIN